VPPEVDGSVSAGSTPQGAGAAAATTDWEKKAKEMEQQLRGVSAERSKFKAEADAWKRIAPEMGDVVQYDPATGLPVSLKLDDGAPAGQADQVSYPFADLGVPESQMAGYVSGLISKGGYITQTQAQQLSAQAAQAAYQAAQKRFSIMRSVDKVLSSKDYSDLKNPDSEWSKRTAQLLVQQKVGQPSYEGAKSWDEWEFADPNTLPMAADIAYAQMVRAGQIDATSQDQAIQNQLAAGISTAGGGEPIIQDFQASIEKAMAEGKDVSELLREGLNKAEAAGLKKF